ncbi:MAG: proton-conducting transporter membrane subunit [Candidatus Bathyarchaeia archaeon]
MRLLLEMLAGAVISAEHYSLALAAILTPITVALLAHLIARTPKIGNSLAKALCILTSYSTLLMLLRLTQIVLGNGPIMSSIPIASLPLGDLTLTIYIDELALIPAIFFALFASAAITYSVKYLSPENKHRSVPNTFNRGFSFMLLFLSSLVGCCFSGNMIFFLVFWEMTSICSFLLVGFWHDDPKCVAAAFKTFIMLHVGTFGLLIGSILTYLTTGTWEIHAWSYSPPNYTITLLATLLFFIGLLPKAVQFPLHSWFPDATITATPIVVYVHNGFLLALYAFLRFYGQIFAPSIRFAETLPPALSSFFGNLSIWAFIMSFIGALTSILAPLFGLLENESKKVIAYCDISALGGTVMTLGFATSLGFAAGLLGMVYHVLFTALIFLALGGAIFQVGKTSMDFMGGLSRYMPITATIGTIGALSMAGFPFLGYFTALWLGVHAALELNAIIFIVLLLLGSILKTAAILRMINAVFFGKAIEYKGKITEPSVLMLFPMLLLLTCLFVFGAYPQLLLNHLVIPAINRFQPDSKLTLAIGDIITGSGFWNPLLGTLIFLMYLGLIAIVVYIALKRRAVYEEKAHVRGEEAFKPFICGEDVNLLDGVRARHFYHVFTNIVKINAVCHALNVDRFYYALAEKFFDFCRVLLRLDIRQKYFPAVLSFTIGALIMTVLAVLVG